MQIYRTYFSLHLGGACRFTPSCSSYALQCLNEFNVCTAIFLIFKRLMKCHPAGPFGYDPVPMKNQTQGESLCKTNSLQH